MDRKALIDYWRPIDWALDPWRALLPDEVDDLYVSRPDQPSMRLADKLWLAKDPADIKVALCGARGSGKTTELARLGHAVKADFCVVQLDLADGLPHPCGTMAIVTLLGAAALQAIQMWSSPDADLDLIARRDSGFQTGLERFTKALNTFGGVGDIVVKLLPALAPVLSVLGVGDGAVEAAPLVVSAAHTALEATQKLQVHLKRDALTKRLPDDKIKDAQAVVEEVNKIFNDLQGLAGRPPLLLVDGLDRRLDMEEVKLALENIELLRTLKAPMILGVPINMRYDMRLQANIPGNFQMTVLHIVPIHRRAHDLVESNDEGIQVLRDIFDHRRSLFNIPNDCFEEALIDQAARFSSGVVREFLHILQTSTLFAFSAGATRVTPEHLNSALRERRLHLQGFLNSSRIKLLKETLDLGPLPDDPDADVMLFENLIVCHANGSTWYRPHDLLVDYVQTYG